MNLEIFCSLPPVLEALKNPRSSRSVLNYMCACDTSDPVLRESLNTDEKVEPLLRIWFQSGSDLDEFCQPFASVIRELKNSPATLVGDEWDNLEGKVAKVLLADQLSRSCFRDSPESFSFDHIGRKLVRELVAKNAIKDTLKLPAAILYLLPWALAHSEEVEDLKSACEVIDMAINAYPNFNLFEGRNKLAVDQHLQVLEKFGRYPQRNAQYGRESTPNEIAWLNDKDNLPMWAGGKLPFDQRIK